MFNKTRLVFYFLLMILFSGCWIPEQFDVKVAINNDGSYTFSYDGILTYALALSASQKGQLSEKDEASFKQLAVKLAEDPDFKKVEYLGKGHYKVSVVKHGKRGERYYFLSKEFQFFSVEPQKDGTVKVGAISPDMDTIQKLESIGAKIAGTLSVSVPRDTKVLNHNAQKEPSFFGFVGDYKWIIKSPTERPMIIVKPSPA